MSKMALLLAGDATGRDEHAHEHRHRVLVPHVITVPAKEAIPAQYTVGLLGDTVAQGTVAQEDAMARSSNDRGAQNGDTRPAVTSENPPLVGGAMGDVVGGSS